MEETKQLFQKLIPKNYDVIFFSSEKFFVRGRKECFFLADKDKISMEHENEYDKMQHEDDENDNKKEVEVLSDSKKSEKDKRLAIKCMEYWGIFVRLSRMWGSGSGDVDLHSLINFARELEKACESFKCHNEETVNQVKQTTYFKFCCGFVALKLCDNEEGKDIARRLFAECCEEEMTKENIIKLINNSPGEDAYWFSMYYLDNNQDPDDL